MRCVVRFFVRLHKNFAGILSYVKGFLCDMMGNMQADYVQSRQACFVQCFLNVKGGNVSKSNYVYFRVYSSKNSSTKYAVSSNAKSTGKGKVNPKYTVTRKAGSKNYLRINASLYNVKVNGTWCS